MPNEGGSAHGSTAESSMDDIDVVLRSLVSWLEKSMCPADEDGNQESLGEQVLLDVEIGDVRLVAVRRGTPSAISMLSPREREIARMVALGHPNKTIASVLDISSWTVASHLRRVFMKLQVTSRAAMITRLYDTGLGALPSAVSELSCVPGETIRSRNSGLSFKNQYESLRRHPERV
jgi:DNA-binding CsgD family transcriptional regulator